MHHIRNAHIVTASEQFFGSISTSRDCIEQVHTGASGLAGEDWHGDYLLPGLVELHTDNLEKHLMPRPMVQWPIMSAIVAHDAQMAAAGITTVLDAIAVGDIDVDSMRLDAMVNSIQGLREAGDHGLLRADHFLHLRLELAAQNLPAMFADYVNDERLKLVSLMDHTPGQRQWSDLAHYRTFVAGKRGWDAQKVDQMLDVLLERQATYVAKNRRAVIERCLARKIPVPMAAHDDTTVEHVHEGVNEGVCISEFPTTLVAAQAARQHGLHIVMGAPNRVRGASHSGNVSASALAKAELLDILSSDYVPASLLHAAFMLQEDGYSLPKALATVTCNPAAVIGLHDRGEIAAQRRADFIRVRMVQKMPVVLEVWKAGQRIV